MSSKNLNLLFGIHAFNAISAIGGGLALMGGAIDQPQWLKHTDFASLYFPGVILFAIVGGSALLAALSHYKRTNTANLASLVAGMVMVFWIGGEIVSIRAFHFLQVIYLLTGLSVIQLTPRGKTLDS